MNAPDASEGLANRSLSALMREALAPRRALATAISELRGTGVIEEEEPCGWLAGEVPAVMLIGRLGELGFAIMPLKIDAHAESK